MSAKGGVCRQHLMPGKQLEVILRGCMSSVEGESERAFRDGTLVGLAPEEACFVCTAGLLRPLR